MYPRCRGLAWRRRTGCTLLLALAFTVFVYFRGCRWICRAMSQPPDEDEASSIRRGMDPLPCQYPAFVLQQETSRESKENVGARARVGTNLQLGVSTNYTVIYNLVSPAGVAPASRLTLATQATPEWLMPNLEELLRHWPSPNPMSVSVFAPGSDFCLAVALISWLWQCSEQVDIRLQVSFHVFFPVTNLPEDLLLNHSRILDVNCLIRPEVNETFRTSHRMAYPINTARNAARVAAETDYVMVSDIELLPSPRLAQNFELFLNLETTRALVEGGQGRVVFVVPTFEIEKRWRLPRNKKELVDLYRRGKVVHFHRFTCVACQKLPDIDEWLRSEQVNSFIHDQSVTVFRRVKRHQANSRWEPIFIGTPDGDPIYDERLVWEGYQDKMSQMQEMCLLNYDFAILDTAFLVHRPGIKRRKPASLLRNGGRYRVEFVRNNQRTMAAILARLKVEYGESEMCQQEEIKVLRL